MRQDTATASLIKTLEDSHSTITKLLADRLLMARLAADKPMFYNPLEAFAAQSLRDKILTEAGLTP